MYNRYVYENERRESTPTGDKRRSSPRPMLSGGFLAGLERSDIALLALLYLLYVESDDSDFLIVLAVIAFSIFRK